MGPLATLFGHLYDENRPSRIAALRAKLSAGDDGGPVILDDANPSLVPPGMALPYQDITERPRPPMRGFRDPEQMGPAPPSNGPLARMFGKNPRG